MVTENLADILPIYATQYWMSLLLVLGIEPRTSRMLFMCSVMELYPHFLRNLFLLVIVSLKPCSSSVRNNKDDIASWKKVVTWSVCRVVWDVWGGKNSELRSAEEALLLLLHCLADHVASS